MTNMLQLLQQLFRPIFETIFVNFVVVLIGKIGTSFFGNYWKKVLCLIVIIKYL